MVEVLINDRWSLMLPEHRANRPEWPWWEATRLAAMSHFIKPGDVVWDIGAEEGDFPALFASWGADVVLIEPNPRVWPNIRLIFEVNAFSDNVIGGFVGFASDVIAEASKEGLSYDQALFRRWSWPECASDAVIGDHGFRHLAQETDTTPQATIDGLREIFPAPQHITMDVEGSELRVLRGAMKSLQVDRPYVWVSVHTDAMRDMYRSNPDQLSGLMASFNYDEIFLSYDHESHVLFIPHEKCWVL